jgi:hypothetical protein
LKQRNTKTAVEAKRPGWFSIIFTFGYNLRTHNELVGAVDEMVRMVEDESRFADNRVNELSSNGSAEPALPKAGE